MVIAQAFPRKLYLLGSGRKRTILNFSSSLKINWKFDRQMVISQSGFSGVIPYAYIVCSVLDFSIRPALCLSSIT